MIDIETVRTMALAFDEAVEQPHFHKSSFRVRKKIFATLDTEKMTVVLKFSPGDQSAFSAFDDSVIYPVPGNWGRHGWTIVELEKVEKEIFTDALTTSYCEVAPKTLAKKYRIDD
ncbi:MAG: MmcQ/YjbR family DNA-binding protein [Pyrinomonadaceae bacterium]|nr:MmcQ/YjbR family DNA-binding protein [Pyrinomonadaceae bacterium]